MCIRDSHDWEPVRADYAHEIEADGSLAIPSTELKHSGVYKAVVANQHGSEEREVKLMVNQEGGTSTAIAFDEIVSTRPIPIPEFGKYVAELHANSNQPFKDLYQVSVLMCMSLLFHDHLPICPLVLTPITTVGVCLAKSVCLLFLSPLSTSAVPGQWRERS